MAEILLFLAALWSICYMVYEWRQDQQETVHLLVDIIQRRETMWQEERSDLLNRIQASSFSEYRNLTNDKSPPRCVNPLRRAFADPDLVPEE